MGGTDRHAGAVWMIYGGVGVLGSLAYPWLPDLAQNLWYNAVAASVVVALLMCAAASRVQDRAPWLLFAVAQAAYTVGDIAWSVTLARQGDVPTASYLDVPYFLYYPFALWGLIELLRRRRAGRELEATIDALIVGVAVTMLTLVLVRPILEDTTISPLERLVSLGYPVLDILLLVVAVRLALGAGHRSVSFRLLMASLLVSTAADLAYATLTWRSSYTEGGLLDLVWLLGYVAFGMAALHPSRVDLTQPSPELPNPMRRGRLGLLAVAGLLPLGVRALAVAFGEHVSVPFVLAGSTLLYLLVLVRVARLVHQQDLAIRREHVLRAAGHDLVVATTDADVQHAVSAAAQRLLGPGYKATLTPGPSNGPEQDRPAQPPPRSGCAVLAFPLYNNDEPRGALVISGAPAVDEATRSALSALATQAALALEAVARDEQRRRFERRFKSIVYTSSDMMFITDIDGVITWCGPSVERLSGYRSDELIGTRLIAHAHPDDLAIIETFVAAVLRADASARADCRMRMRDGSYRVLQVTGRNLLGDEAVAGLLWTGLDVTERRQLEDQLRGRAFHDPLTGLANRALFVDRLEHALTAEVDGATTAVLFIDLDDFKTVNDSLGHDAGDELLVLASHRIAAGLRPSDTAARFGGDEFAVLLEHTNEQQAATVAQQVLANLAAPFDIHDRDVFVHASIGVAVSDGSNPGAMLRNADIAMYRAKTTGKRRYDTFRSDMHTDAVRRLELYADLERGLDRDEFLAYYQPIVSLVSGRIVSFEALVRWQHPQRGLLRPHEFVPLAEETGLIEQLGERILREASRQASVWRARYDPTLTLAVNLATRQILTGTLLDVVEDALQASGLDAAFLTLELTENALFADVESAARTLRNLRSLGVRIAIDDFGTGYSSLAYLQQFPVDVLKVDRSFIVGLLDPTRSPTIVSMIVELSHSLGATTVAEGIEEWEQVRRLRELGCTLGQGYLFARPLAVEDVEQTLANGGLRRFDLAATSVNYLTP
jgi:diguanylate cyclase (GGDEF)-like protein/PAS domain S-box-containing protein